MWCEESVGVCVCVCVCILLMSISVCAEKTLYETLP